MKAYIFDLDGTILDSMWVWARIDHDFLKNRGIEVPAGYTAEIAPLSVRECAEYTIKRFGFKDSPEDLMREWNDMAVLAYSTTVTVKPGVIEYLTALKNEGIRMAIATSSWPELYIPAMENNSITHYFDAICNSTEAGCGKTRPDIYLLAARKLGVQPADCVVLEDVLEGIKSAKSAGMTVYGVYDDSSKEKWEEIKKTADGVIYDFSNAPIEKG